MSLSDKEIAVELTISAIAAGLLKVKGDGGTNVGTEVASLYKKIHGALAADSAKPSKKKKQEQS